MQLIVRMLIKFYKIMLLLNSYFFVNYVNYDIKRPEKIKFQSPKRVLFLFN